MKVTLESTDKIVQLRYQYGGEKGHMEARVWEGTTESGIKVHAFITRIAVAEIFDAAQFKAELQECRPPSPEVEAIPLRLIL